MFYTAKFCNNINIWENLTFFKHKFMYPSLIYESKIQRAPPKVQGETSTIIQVCNEGSANQCLQNSPDSKKNSCSNWQRWTIPNRKVFLVGINYSQYHNELAASVCECVGLVYWFTVRLIEPSFKRTKSLRNTNAF